MTTFSPGEGPFSGQHAVVTGGVQGLGLAIAEAFLDEGASVSAIDLGEQPSAEFHALEARYPGRTFYHRADVAEEDSFLAALTAAHALRGRLDILVNNAGIGQARISILDTTVEEFDRLIGVDLRSVFLGIKLAAPMMLEGDGGAIVNISSAMGLVAQPGVAAYAAAKHGVIGLTKTAALELGSRGIRVNAVCPGRHDTPMIRAWRPEGAEQDPDYQSEVRRNHPATHRVGLPEEIAAAVLFLSSRGASNIHGVALPVDGGWTAQ